jgi:hypothetical protein
MADISWIAPVRESKQLNIDTSGTSGVWAQAVAAAMKEMNALFARHAVMVKLSSEGPATVVLGLSDGQYKFDVQGSEMSGTLRSDILHGATRSIDRLTGASNRHREKAYVFLPSSPRVPGPGTSRVVGEPVMRVIAAHEFLHALGLDTHDSSMKGLLASSWSLNQGRSSNKDSVSPFGSRTEFPPLSLSADTVRRLKALW